jgi:hypothetical protein
MFSQVDLAKRKSRVLFDHASTQACYGASAFWRRLLVLLIARKQRLPIGKSKRDGGQRGIVEIVFGVTMIDSDQELQPAPVSQPQLCAIVTSFVLDYSPHC